MEVLARMVLGGISGGLSGFLISILIVLFMQQLGPVDDELRQTIVRSISIACGIFGAVLLVVVAAAEAVSRSTAAPKMKAAAPQKGGVHT